MGATRLLAQRQPQSWKGINGQRTKRWASKSYVAGQETFGRAEVARSETGHNARSETGHDWEAETGRNWGAETGRNCRETPCPS